MGKQAKASKSRQQAKATSHLARVESRHRVNTTTQHNDSTQRAVDLASQGKEQCQCIVGSRAKVIKEQSIFLLPSARNKALLKGSNREHCFRWSDSGWGWGQTMAEGWGRGESVAGRLGTTDLGGEGPQPHLVRVGDVLRVRLLPRCRDLRLVVRVHEQVERACRGPTWRGAASQ